VFVNCHAEFLELSSSGSAKLQRIRAAFSQWKVWREPHDPETDVPEVNRNNAK
jgi:hypothetical protein